MKRIIFLIMVILLLPSVFSYNLLPFTEYNIINESNGFSVYDNLIDIQDSSSQVRGGFVKQNISHSKNNSFQINGSFVYDSTQSSNQGKIIFAVTNNPKNESLSFTTCSGYSVIGLVHYKVNQIFPPLPNRESISLYYCNNSVFSSKFIFSVQQYRVNNLTPYYYTFQRDNQNNIRLWIWDNHERTNEIGSNKQYNNIEIDYNNLMISSLYYFVVSDWTGRAIQFNYSTGLMREINYNNPINNSIIYGNQNLTVNVSYNSTDSNITLIEHYLNGTLIRNISVFDYNYEDSFNLNTSAFTVQNTYKLETIFLNQHGVYHKNNSYFYIDIPFDGYINLTNASGITLNNNIFYNSSNLTLLINHTSYYSQITQLNYYLNGTFIRNKTYNCPVHPICFNDYSWKDFWYFNLSALEVNKTYNLTSIFIDEYQRKLINYSYFYLTNSGIGIFEEKKVKKAKRFNQEIVLNQRYSIYDYSRIYKISLIFGFVFLFVISKNKKDNEDY